MSFMHSTGFRCRFIYLWPFVPLGKKGLRELNICETKKCEIKVYELYLEKWKYRGKIVNEQIFIACTYLFMDLFYFDLKSHKIEHIK